MLLSVWYGNTGLLASAETLNKLLISTKLADAPSALELSAIVSVESEADEEEDGVPRVLEAIPPPVGIRSRVIGWLCTVLQT
jgi:hypothetical protein